ncbi:MAG: hypothetical protein ACRDRD_16075, partial [Pseudonocardiaceae bacterium]
LTLSADGSRASITGASQRATAHDATTLGDCVASGAQTLALRYNSGSAGNANTAGMAVAVTGDGSIAGWAPHRRASRSRPPSASAAATRERERGRGLLPEREELLRVSRPGASIRRVERYHCVAAKIKSLRMRRDPSGEETGDQE